MFLLLYAQYVLVKYMMMHLPNLRAAQTLAQRLADMAWAGKIVYLQGNLGAGKTTFVQALLCALGYEGRVKSPTYTLLETYVLSELTVYHFDLYRIADPEELEWLDMRACFTENALVIVEWPEKGQGFLPKPDVTLQFSYQDTQRIVTMTPSLLS